MKQLILDTLSKENVRPFTDCVQVSAPDSVQFGVDFTYFIPRNSVYSAAVIEKNVAVAVEKYVSWQTSKMERDIDPDELRFLLREAGVKRPVIRSPAYTVVGETSVAVLDGEAEIICGGLENE